MKTSSLILPVVMPVFMACAAAPAQFVGSTEALQQGGNGNPTSTMVLTVPQPCPVGLQAKQGGMTNMVKVKDGDKARPEPGPRQRIHLVIGGTGLTAAGTVGPVKVVSATVTARGLSARARVDRAAGDGSLSADVRRTVDLKFTPDENGTMTADLILPGFTAVNSIKLESITYADGMSRDLAGKAFCKVVPDPIMLVADR